MVLDEINDYKRTLRLCINALGLSSSSFFATIQLKDGLFLMAALSIASVAYFSSVIFYLYQHRRHLWDGWGFVLVGPGVLLHALYVNPEYGIYWTYVSITTLFLMLPLRNATISAIAYTAATLLFTVPFFDTSTLYRIYSTVILVGVFSFCFSYLINKLLHKLNATTIYDPMTKALNRHTFNKSIDKVLTEHRRHQVTSVLFLFDLDHFKRINDEHGHLTGDEVLKEVSKITQNRVRETDQFFRYGGEEFAILMRHTSLQNAAYVAEQLRAIIQDHTFKNGLSVTISGGLSEVHQSIDVNGWIERSDHALYEAKSSGRNCIKIHIPPLENWSPEQSTLLKSAE